MRIGLYGMPSSGKTHILDQIDFLKTYSGSKLLKKYARDFDQLSSYEKSEVRKEVACFLKREDNFVMDGHYAFGDEIAFTNADGDLYDAFIYLYISPAALKQRMESSPKNKKYSSYDIKKWQNEEISNLRLFCHQHNKDFYVIDNPPMNDYVDVSMAIRFIKSIANGYSCLEFAKKCVVDILKRSNKETITLLDGDKTITIEDSSNAVFGYNTHLYDGNFYTGYQAWKQNDEFKNYNFDKLTEMPVHFNSNVISRLTNDSFILTSGHEKIWRFIADRLKLTFYVGVEMSAETKLFITKMLQDAGKYVIAYGDGMNDYFMLKQANEGYLVTKPDGRISRSLVGRDLEGLIIVRIGKE